MLHKKLIVHRDLNLSNILVHNNTIKIADFGFATKLSHEVLLKFII
jgi:serine/threonine-protein kinase ULK/ATG1/polo-like kinase 4